MNKPVEHKTDELHGKSEATLRFILDNSETAYMLLDEQMHIVTANPKAKELLLAEFSKTANNGELLTDYLPDLYRQPFINLIESAIKGVPFRKEIKYTNRNGRIGWYSIHLDAIKDDSEIIVGLCLSINETTLQHSAKAEMLSMNDLLDNKVKERTEKLEIANQELEAFTYSVSHDLLAPLRTIDGFTQVLLDDYRNKLDEGGLETLRVIKRNATRMGDLVNDLLNLARLGKVNLVKDHVDMNDLVSTVIDELKFSTNKLAAKIKLKELKPAKCDQVLIKQVWANLLSNAIKYSRKCDEPLIEIGNIERNGKTVYYIKDNGVGFDPLHAGKLFGVFQRLHKAIDFPGTGVGLAIVHRIINRHNGKIWADAKPGVGAVFYFTLP